MNTSLVLIGGFTMFFNFAILIYKFKAGRHLDAVLDTGTFVAIAYITLGSATGFVAGMIASALLSLFLLIFNPFKDMFTEESEYYDDGQPA